MTNYDLEKILPHNHPMILIDDIIEYNKEEQSLTSKVTIHEKKLFFDKSINGVPSCTGIEFMAQTIGCYAFFRNNEEPPKIGFLLGARLMNCAIDKFENGKTYTQCPYYTREKARNLSKKELRKITRATRWKRLHESERRLVILLIIIFGIALYNSYFKSQLKTDL